MATRRPLVRVVAAIVAILLALLGIVALWAVYENTLTAAAVGLSRSGNVRSSAPGQLYPTAARAFDAYGGEVVWRGANTVQATVTVGGFLFQQKGINIPPHARFTVDVQRPHTVIDPVDGSGDIGILDGFSVTIESSDGKVLEQRDDARRHLQNPSLSTRWERLNLVYFLRYAFSRYLTLPYQLMRTDIVWTELGDGELQADYGSNLPVHSRIQRFWFDTKTGLLRRNHYAPVAAALNVDVANVVFEHRTSNGIPYASKRRVKLTPVQYAWVLPPPAFITIHVEPSPLQ